MTSLTLLATAVCLSVFAMNDAASHLWDQRGAYPYFPYGPYYYHRPRYPYGYVYGPVPTFVRRGSHAGSSQGRQDGSTSGQVNGSRDAAGNGSRDAVDNGGQDAAGDGGQDATQRQLGNQDGGRGMGGVDRSRAPPNPADAIAFSGNRKTSQFFFQQGPVIFNDVTTNIGGGYSADYGVFTAFESGIYLVSYSVVSQRQGARRASVDLLKNNKVINSASGSGSSGETSNSAVLFLDRFDQLSVQGRAGSAVFCGDGRDALCTFSVALLKIGYFTNTKEARPVPGW